MKNYLIILILLFISIQVFSQKNKTEANIKGKVICNGIQVPFANVVIKGTTIGTVTDENGQYILTNIPLGTASVVVSTMGYKPQEINISVEENKTIDLNFELKEDILSLEEVVVSADRSAQKRTEAPVIVNTISPKLLRNTQSVTLSEGLCFSPGLRLENNCQNCGFTQVRMNGLEGPYSQILINSRPIFSGLAGVYGLELIPANMIERIEVVRGGGSALFGSNAIAGTINIILKDPASNSFEISSTFSHIGVGSQTGAKAVPDYTVQLNTSMVSEDRKTGFSLYGFTRDRKMFDANGDTFSEIAPMNNLTLGSRFHYKLSQRGKLAIDFFTIREEREGGNKQDLPLHERDVAEAVKHNLKTSAITVEQFIRQYDLLSFYISGQFLDRDSYYGANQSLKDYGHSKDRTYNAGVQYKANLSNSSLVAGIENTGGYLKDTKLGYPDYSGNILIPDAKPGVMHVGNTTVADQSSVITGVFAQYELKLNKTKLAVGGRFDHYKVEDHAKKNSSAKSGNVFSPRISLIYRVLQNMQARLSYSRGYRAPQIFDEDLHIETSGSRQVINVNAADLSQETSHSFMSSLDYHGFIGTIQVGFLLEGFYTGLEDPFVNEIGIPDENGTVLYTRKNAEEGAKVRGFNSELKVSLSKVMSLTSGFTIQSSRYDVPQEFNEKRFFRTPDKYGFLTVDWDFRRNFCLTATGNYTGKMLVPYFGTANPDGELRMSGEFLDLGSKLSYTLNLKGATIELSGGVKNLLNAYQKDFDSGKDRDPSYMYGPVSPRSIFLGIKIGNLL